MRRGRGSTRRSFGRSAAPRAAAPTGRNRARRTELPTTNYELVMSFTLTSDAFKDGEWIPRRFTCEGEDLSPPLAWSGAPEGTQSFALLVDDPDAPRGTFTHWILFDVPVDVTGLDEGVHT